MVSIIRALLILPAQHPFTCFALSILATLGVLISPGPSADQWALSISVWGCHKTRARPVMDIRFLPGIGGLRQVKHEYWHLSSFLLSEFPELPWSLPFQKLDCLAVDWILWDVPNPFNTFFFLPMLTKGWFWSFSIKGHRYQLEIHKGVGNQVYWEGQEWSPLPDCNSPLIMVSFLRLVFWVHSFWAFYLQEFEAFYFGARDSFSRGDMLITLSLNCFSWFYL